MNPDVLLVLIGISILITNGISLIIVLPRKFHLTVTISLFVAYSIAFFVALDFLGAIVPDNAGLPGLAFLPIVLFLFKGNLFQKIFAYFLFFILTSFLFAISEAISHLFIRYGENVPMFVFLIMLPVFLIVYIGFLYKTGRHFFKRLFELGTTKEWAFYSFGATLSFAIMAVMQIIPQNPIYVTFMLILILWSFAVLCFAIISTHEKSKRQYEAELARNIIHSGSDYYKKMNEMSEQLRIMRHDYKFHLTSMQKMIDDGDTSHFMEYIAKVSDGIDDNAVDDYCSNRVLNALIYGYAERCKAADILFSAKIIPPPADTVDDYELCIITGNLLENAVTACMRTPLETQKYIEISMRPREDQYGIKVENSYDGVLRYEEKELYSIKKNGGLGISSIKAIASRHNGEYVPVWDEQKFGAFVLLKFK
jgi:hypothetical protein